MNTRMSSVVCNDKCTKMYKKNVFTNNKTLCTYSLPGSRPERAQLE